MKRSIAVVTSAPAEGACSASSTVLKLEVVDGAFSAYDSLDLTSVDSWLTGGYACFAEGDHGYFLPNHNGQTSGNAAFRGEITRVDLTADFVAASASVLQGAAPMGYGGGFSDDNYGCACSGLEQHGRSAPASPPHHLLTHHPPPHLTSTTTSSSPPLPSTPSHRARALLQVPRR